MIIRFDLITGFFILFLLSCDNEESNNDKFYQSKIIEFSDKEYPDNEDIESRTDLWNKYNHNLFQVKRNDTRDFTIQFLPENDYSDTIIIDHVDLLTFIPTVPDHIIMDPYLKDIGIINSEWNRHQVQFSINDFQLSDNNEENKNTVRVDLVRNCLNSYAWEIVTFTEEENVIKPMYHGWFDFPKEFYRELFNEVNAGKLTFKEYEKFLENYIEPEKKVINFNILRKVVNEKEVIFNDYRMKGYPLTAARKFKYKNIVYPKNPKTINDMLTDSTLYSTFQWPGLYDTKDPRSSTLSMLGIPKKVIVRQMVSMNKQKDQGYEFDITFSRNTDTNYLTRVVVGGIKEEDLVKMPIEQYNKAFKKPLGIGNHGFYEDVNYAYKHPSSLSPFYGFIIDSEGKWVDNHFFGVDGPLIHLDDKDDNLIHFWLLSFERHAMVTHLTFFIR